MVGCLLLLLLCFENNNQNKFLLILFNLRYFSNHAQNECIPCKLIYITKQLKNYQEGNESKLEVFRLFAVCTCCS